MGEEEDFQKFLEAFCGKNRGWRGASSRWIFELGASMVTDPIADLLTRIRNAQVARQRYVEVYASRMNRELLGLISREGFVDRFEDVQAEKGGAKMIRVRLKYYRDGNPAIASLVRVSKPGRRVYKGAEELGRVRQGLGIAIVSTSQGIMTDREARRKNVGGELLATVA